MRWLIYRLGMIWGQTRTYWAYFTGGPEAVERLVIKLERKKP
jgi:hypothetical protein